jgi:hypothetical protein
MEMFRVAALWGLLLACAESPSSAGTAVVANEVLIVPGVRVGNFVLGRDTLASVLGSDTPEARHRFAEQGLVFQFEQGKQLRGIMVSSPRFRTRHGFRVGSKASAIEEQLGTPVTREVREVHGKFELPVLAYPGITFLLSDGSVRAVRIGKL